MQTFPVCSLFFWNCQEDFVEPFLQHCFEVPWSVFDIEPLLLCNQVWITALTLVTLPGWKRSSRIQKVTCLHSVDKYKTSAATHTLYTGNSECECRLTCCSRDEQEQSVQSVIWSSHRMTLRASPQRIMFCLCFRHPTANNRKVWFIGTCLLISDRSIHP